MPTLSLQEFEARVEKGRNYIMSLGGFPSKRTRPHDPGKAALLIKIRVAAISKNPGIVRDENGEWRVNCTKNGENQ